MLDFGSAGLGCLETAFGWQYNAGCAYAGMNFGLWNSFVGADVVEFVIALVLGIPLAAYLLHKLLRGVGA